jgi:hypothetical protein
VVDRIMVDEQRFDPLLLLSILKNRLFLGPIVIGIIAFLFADDFSKALVGVDKDTSPFALRQYAALLLFMRLSGVALVGFSLLSLFQDVVALVRLRRFRLQTLTNMMDDGAPTSAFRRAKAAMDNAVEEAGLRRAIARTRTLLDKEGFPHHVFPDR